MKVFLDANILFSGSQTGSPIRKLLDALGRHSVLVTHPCVLQEAARNLAAKKPEWIGGFESLREQCELSSSFGTCPPNPLPEKDQPVLAAALGCGAALLVTGDRRHFGSLYGSIIGGVEICSVRQLAEKMIARGWLVGK